MSELPENSIGTLTQVSAECGYTIPDLCAGREASQGCDSFGILGSISGSFAKPGGETGASSRMGR